MSTTSLCDPLLPRRLTPSRVRLLFDRPDAAKLDLKVTVFDVNRKVLATAEVRGASELEFDAKDYGMYHVQIDPLDPDGPWPEDTRYTLRWKEFRP